MGRGGHGETLTRSRLEDHDRAVRHRDEIVGAARSLVLATAHGPDTTDCVAAGCGLAAITLGPELCRLATRLGGLPGGQPGDELPLVEAVTVFRRALTTGLDAVRACRQTVHPVNGCWFGDGDDGCAEVLRLGHRLA